MFGRGGWIGSASEGNGDLTDGAAPGEFSRTHMTFFGPWDGWKIPRMQPLFRDASVFVELGFDHGG